MRETMLEDLCRGGDDFYARGDAFGGSGNLSVRSGGAVWITPTGSALKGLRPADLAEVDLDGSPRGENRPSKEYPFHLAIYRQRSDINAVVHLHAPHSVAVSCLAELRDHDPLPPLTPYYVMRVAPLGVVDYFRPGSDDLAVAVGEKAADFDCMLMRNHGLICTGPTFADAAARAVELEETCRLYFIIRGSPVRTLSDDDIRDLRHAFSDGRR